MNAPPSRAAIAGHELERFPGATRVRVETPDLNGGLRGKYVALERLRNGGVIALPEVYLSLDVLDRVFESSISAEADGFGDMVIAPDWTSARPMPGEPGVIAVVADGLTSTGQRHSLHPRSALRNVVERAASSGFSATFGVEYEFSLFRQREPRDSRPFPGLSDLGLMSRSTQGYSLTRWSSLREFATDLDAASREYDPMWLRMIDHADQLVVATTTRDDHAEAGALLLEALAERDQHSADLASGAVAVVSQADPKATRADVERVVTGYQTLARETITIPFDPAMVDGVLRFGSLRRPTQRAWLDAAAAVARGL